jgi:hypothetical protein
LPCSPTIIPSEAGDYRNFIQLSNNQIEVAIHILTIHFVLKFSGILLITLGNLFHASLISSSLAIISLGTFRDSVTCNKNDLKYYQLPQVKLFLSYFSIKIKLS